MLPAVFNEAEAAMRSAFDTGFRFGPPLLMNLK